MVATTRLTELTTCGGCVAKAGPAWLTDLLLPLGGLFDPGHVPGLLVGLEQSDDAAIYRLNDETALVATVDFFPPLVDDAFTYGAIAAANALSDVFAMGGEVAFAMNVAAFPETLPLETVRDILRGGAAKVAEAGGAIAGGHTIWAEEPSYGLSVIGFVHPDRIFSKAGLRAGDVLYLTKAIGTGTILSAVRDQMASAETLGPATGSMLRLNAGAARIMSRLGVAAATDVTGFGLLGHLWEMLTRSGLSATVHAPSVPLLPAAAEAAAAGVATSGGGRNRDWVASHVTFEQGVPDEVRALLFDPQTSGGLLFGCPRADAASVQDAFSAAGEPLWEIGSISPEDEPRIHVVSAAA